MQKTPQEVRTREGLLIATDHERVVHGSRGSYVEMTNAQVVQDNIHMPDGAKWRNQEPYELVVYYLEYRTTDVCYLKLYHQKRRVSYADYKIGYWYVSVKDVVLPRKN